MDWIDLARKRDRWQAVVNAVKRGRFIDWLTSVFWSITPCNLANEVPEFCRNHSFHFAFHVLEAVL